VEKMLEQNVMAQDQLEWARTLRITQELALSNAKLAGELVAELADVHTQLREVLGRIGDGQIVGPAELCNRRMMQALSVQRAATLMERYAQGLAPDAARG